jgi:hypothetical protein
MPGQILTTSSQVMCMHGGTVQKYSPCVRVEWTGGTSKMKSNETNILVRSSIGKCISAEGATQGIATIAMTQTKVTAT